MIIPSLNYAVLTDALHALKDGNIRYCESLGFTFDEMNALNQLSLDELFIISRESAQFLAVTVHHDALHLLLAKSREEVLQQQRINHAIRLGGSIALLNKYFGLTSNEVCLRRRLLGVRVPYGRTPEPDEETDAAIWRQWHNAGWPTGIDRCVGRHDAGNANPAAESRRVVTDHRLEAYRTLRTGGVRPEGRPCQMRLTAIRNLMSNDWRI